MSTQAGAGKTTLAGHVGIQAHATGKIPVALLDTDGSKALSGWIDSSGNDNLDCLPVKAGKLATTLDELAAEAIDLAVVDTADVCDDDLRAIAEQADLIVVPVTPEGEDPPEMDDLLDMFEDVNKPFVFVLNKADLQADETHMTAIALAQHGTISPVIVPSYPGIAAAVQAGKTVVGGGDDDAVTIGDLWDYLSDRLDRAPRTKRKAPAGKKATAVTADAAAPVPSAPEEPAELSAADKAAMRADEKMAEAQKKLAERLAAKKAADEEITEDDIKKLMLDPFL